MTGRLLYQVCNHACLLETLTTNTLQLLGMLVRWRSSRLMVAKRNTTGQLQHKLNSCKSAATQDIHQRGYTIHFQNNRYTWGSDAIPSSYMVYAWYVPRHQKGYKGEFDMFCWVCVVTSSTERTSASPYCFPSLGLPQPDDPILITAG